MPATLDDLLHLKDVPDEEETRSSLDQAGSILARAREDKLERIRKAELTERRKEARRNLMRAPSPLKDDLRKDIEAILEQLQKLDPQHQLNGGPQQTRNTWIAKPAAKSRGRGIATFDDLDRLLDHCDAKTGGSGALWIVQKYMESQLLIAERKFDLRQWVLVTDWNPLTIYFYDECYARFTSHKFTDARESLENPFVHLVNNSIQKDGENFHDDVCAENGVAIEDCMWPQEDFASFLDWKMARTDATTDRLRRCKESDDVFGDVVQPEMRKIAVEVLQAARDSIEHRKNSWEL
jgi:tubulin monoglycylase TTLL3/8